MGRDRDVGRKYPSGKEKRDKKRKLQENMQKQRGVLKKMFLTNSDRLENSSVDKSEEKPEEYSKIRPSENLSVSIEKDKSFPDESIGDRPSKNLSVSIEKEKHLPDENSESRSSENLSVSIEKEKGLPDASSEDRLSENISVPTENGKSLPDDDIYPDDVATWELGGMRDKQIDFYIKNKPPNIGDITALTACYTDRYRNYQRSFLEQHFYRCKPNGEKEKREWLVYSETSKSIYCYICKLFAVNTTNKFITGFNDWKNVVKCLSDHETSKEHMLSMCRFSKRSSVLGRIDTEIEKQLISERNYWREVLKRVVATVKLLSKLGIAFRGHDESQFSRNKGNYLSALEYLGEFDEFIKNHIVHYGNGGQGKSNYFSHQIFEEFIDIMAKHLKDKIINNIHESIYFSIILDSTPDISHVDQLSLIIRYLTKSGEVKESFLEFIPINSHTAESLEKIVLEKLNELNINIKNCRGQTYDNASNMSGKYKGLQARIKSHSRSALFIPCCSHSLNLIGNSAAESCSEATVFFNFLQNLFVFFSTSSQRWNILSKCLEKAERHLTLKKISDTRWSSRADALTSLKRNYSLIHEALQIICDDSSQRTITKIEANSLKEKLCKYETKLMTALWYQILNRLNATNLALQNSTLNILKAETLLQSCKEFILEFRDNYEFVEKVADSLFEKGEKEYQSEYSRKKTRNKRPFFDESHENEVTLTGKNAFIYNVFNVICDVLISELDTRSKNYKEIVQIFKIFFDQEINQEEKDNCIENLCNLYKDDIDGELLKEEIAQFLHFCKSETVVNPNDMYLLIHNLDLCSTFPNVEIILRIFLTMPLSNASAERSFSVLKRIKNYLRNTLTQDKLSSLSILNIESEELNDMNYDVIIDKFAALKSRKKVI